MSKFDDIFKEKASESHKRNVMRSVESEMAQLEAQSQQIETMTALPSQSHLQFLTSWRTWLRLSPIFAMGATAALVWILMPPKRTDEEVIDVGEDMSLVSMDDYEMLEDLDLLEQEDLEMIELLDEIESEV